MIPIIFPKISASVVIAGLSLAIAVIAEAVSLPESLTEVARGTFDNTTSEPPSNHTAVTTAIQGTSSPANDGLTHLSEFSVGHTFAPYTLYGSYASDVAAAVRSELYPAPTAEKREVDKSIANGGTAFRYKVLLYNTDGTTDVTNHFDQMDDWYGDPERNLIKQQIKILRVALANAPYSSELRNLFLDAHTDRAVAELQFIKSDLVELAKKRLGVTLVSDFIIDEEIALLESVTKKLRNTLADFSKIFTEEMEGVEPSEIDPSAVPGTTFGYYIFQQQQPKRNNIASRYFEGTGDDATQGPVPAPTGGPPRPVDDVLFSGYRDYTAILQIMAEFLVHTAELNRARGMRQLPAGGSSIGDLAKAQNEITQILKRMPNDLCLLSAMFPQSVSFHPIHSALTNTTSDVWSVNKLVEGPGAGFSGVAPFEKLGENWETDSPGNASSDYFAEAATNPVIILDLGADVTLSEISLWGFPSDDRHNVSEFSLQFATEAEGSSSFGTSINFNPIYTVDNNDFARQSFPFGIELTARYVEFTALDNFFTDGQTGGNRVGLGEIAFERPSGGPSYASGVHAARTAVEQGLSDLVAVRSFLNGTTNILGLDPDFIVFLQNENEDSDSFEIFVDRVKKGGPNKPLTVALDKLAAAKGAYTTFRESVDQVTQELADLNTTYKNRFFAITGYTTTEAIEIDPVTGWPKWNGVTPKLGSGSELDVVSENLQLLDKRIEIYEDLKALFKTGREEALKTLTTANGLDKAIDTAQADYLAEAGFYFDMLATSNALAAGTQAATDTVNTLAQADALTTTFTLGFNVNTAAIAGGVNTVVQTADAALSRHAEGQIDAAAFAYQTTTQKQDNALTVQQARDAQQDLLREEQGSLAEHQELLSAQTQAQSRRTALLKELGRIKASLATNTDRVRSKYYADPIHFLRSQNALLEADARFREAQRWLFLTQRALEHKWTQAFAIRSEGTETGDTEKSYDQGSIFKMRNAQELEDLLTAYVNFDNDRTIKFGVPSTTSRYTVVSLKNDIIAPNPRRFNASPSLRSDDGIRVDLATGDTVSQDELFRRKLERAVDSDGIRLRLNTALLNKAGFFNGTQFSSTTSKVNIPGEWRDKIIYVKISVVASDHNPGQMPETLFGSLSYGGMTVFRIPRIPLPAISDRLLLPSNAEQSSGLTRWNPETGSMVSYNQFLDRPGEFITAPFRHFVPSQLSFDGDIRNIDKLFQASNSQLGNANIAYWDKSLTEIVPSDPTLEDTLGSTFQIDDFRELSVAATSWSLFIASAQTSLPAGAINIDHIEDIELLIRHRADTRITPPELQP